MSKKKVTDAAVFEAIRDLARERAETRIDAAIEMFLDKIVQEEIRKAVRSRPPMSRWNIDEGIRKAVKERIRIAVERQIPSIDITLKAPAEGDPR